tara:strand:+ start:33 stop:842 length:810 start_codon:yes stop_codon:yes gene_type:complete
MIACGVTGYNGNLGKKFIKTFKKYKFIKFKGDITKKKDLEKWFNLNKLDFILHFASIVPTRIVNNNYKKALNVNYNGTKNIVNIIAKNKKLKWFFFASTSHVYKETNKKIKESFVKKPTSLYGLTKLKAENYIIKKLKNTSTKYCIGRIFSIADNKKKEFLIPSLIQKTKTKKKKIIFYDLNHYRDFITTKEISQIIDTLWQKKYSGIINISSGKKIYLKNLAKYICKKNNKVPIFKDNKYPTTIISDTQKLKKIWLNKKRLNFIEFFH